MGPEPKILHDLLTRGASVHSRNRANNTPLYLAEKMGNREAVGLLKEAGAHLWVAERDGSRSTSVSASARNSVAGSVSLGFVDVDATFGESPVGDGDEKGEKGIEEVQPNGMNP